MVVMMSKWIFENIFVIIVFAIKIIQTIIPSNLKKARFIPASV